MTTVESAVESRREVSGRYRTFMSRRASLLPTLAAVAILFLLFIGAEIFLRGEFITPRNISALLLDNAYLLILAVGMTFVIMTGGIDLSVGSVMAFTGIWLAKLLDSGTSLAIALPAILLGGALVGLLIGVLVQYFEVQPFIASLAGLFLARGLAFVVSLSSILVENETVLALQSTRFRLGDWYITPTGILALLVTLIGVYVMQYTRFGRTTYAIGGNEQASLMGLKVARTTVAVYVISGVCGALAGLVLTAYSGAGYPRNGIGTELDVIAAVVIGGTVLTGGRGYVLGSMVGVFVYGTIKTIISFMGAEQSWTQIIIGALLLVFIVVQRAIVARSDRRSRS
jgi:galactofuranose transport system permease protein